MLSIDFLTVIVAAVIALIISILWYSPMLFGSMLLKQNLKAKNWLLFVTLLFPILVLMSFFLAVIGFYLNVASFRDGAILGLFIWLGFVLPPHLFSVFIAKKGWKVFFLEDGIWLINLALLGGIVGG